MARYELKNLARRYGGIVALDGVDLAVESRSLVVVLGPTGAGKTTLLRMVAGLERPDEGTVWCDGQDITGWTPPERDMAMVFQNFSLYPRKTVYENLAFPLRPRWRRMSEAAIDQRVRWAADLLEIGDKLAARPTELSGGQQQRVAIGRAIVREPKLFLLDEPLASLDAKLRESMIVEIHRLQRRLGVTMLYVTHDQTEAMSLADRIVVLDGGKILQVGTPAEIYDRPVSPRVASMLGAPPINLLSSAEAEGLGLAARAGETVGIRAEDVRLVPNPTGGRAARVSAEHLGPVTVVLLRVGEVPLRAVVSAEDAQAAEAARSGALRYEVEIDPARVLRWG